MTITIAKHLDLRGMSRPKPLLEFAQVLIDARPGELLEIVTSDSTTVADFARWAESTGNDLLESSQFGTEFRFVARKAARS
jgi:tRNA 2-thiouridine synthesizing protein A